MEARGGIEPPIKVLQTFALPLGDRAVVTGRFIITSRPDIISRIIFQTRSHPFASRSPFRIEWRAKYAKR